MLDATVPMRPFVRQKLRDNFIPFRTVASELGVSLPEISQAFAGNRPMLLQRIIDLCTDDWITLHKGLPKRQNVVLESINVAAIESAKRKLVDLNSEIDFRQPRGSEMAKKYYSLVRLGTNFVVYHYFGLLYTIDSFLDSRQASFVVDHRLSLDFGYQLRIPFFMLCCPFNLQPMSGEENTLKGVKCSCNTEELLTAFNEIVLRYPRWLLTVLRGIDNTKIPPPSSLTELSYKKSNYTNSNGIRHVYSKNYSAVILDASQLP